LKAPAQKVLAPAEALKEKMTTQFSTIQSEIMGATMHSGPNLGADVGLEIQKEHPEYFENASAKPPIQ
jgi:hypothetical protein